MIIQIPKAQQLYRVVQDWAPMVGWEKRNLVLLRKQGFTGMKKVSMGTYSVYDYNTGSFQRDENGAVIREERFVNKTVVNPLFRDDEGTTVPVMVHIPADSVINITEFKLGYQGIREVWFKIISSSDKTLRNCCATLPPERFNGVELEEVTE